MLSSSGVVLPTQNATEPLDPLQSIAPSDSIAAIGRTGAFMKDWTRPKPVFYFKN